MSMTPPTSSDLNLLQIQSILEKRIEKGVILFIQTPVFYLVNLW